MNRFTRKSSLKFDGCQSKHDIDLVSLPNNSHIIEFGVNFIENNNDRDIFIGVHHRLIAS